MNKRRSLWLLMVIGGVLVLGATVLTSCAQDTSAPELQVNVDTIDDPGDQPDTVVVALDDADTNVFAVEFTDQACLDCHTDEALLRELAVEDEDPEASLSSGPG